MARVRFSVLSQIFDIMDSVGFREHAIPSAFVGFLQSLNDMSDLILRNEAKVLLIGFIEELFRRSKEYNSKKKTLQTGDTLSNSDKKNDFDETGSLVDFKAFSKHLNSDRIYQEKCIQTLAKNLADLAYSYDSV